MAYILTKYSIRVGCRGLVTSLLTIDIVPGARRAGIPVRALLATWPRRVIWILWGIAGG